MVLREADTKGRFLYFVLEYVLLVEEKNDGGLGEPFVVADAVKEFQGLVQAVL